MKKRLLHRLCFDRWLLLYLDITEDRAQKDHQSKKRLVVLLTYDVSSAAA